MKRIFYIMGLALMAFTAGSCSQEEMTEGVNDERLKLEAVHEFEKSFDARFKTFLMANNKVAKSSNELLDSMMNVAGDKICDELIDSSEKLLRQFGLTNEVLENATREVAKECSVEQIPIRELKCFTALAIYECYKIDNGRVPGEQNKKAQIKKASYVDVLGCIGLGLTAKEIASIPAKEIAKFAAKKLAGRLIPYVGWGWAAASAALCLSQL